MTPSAATGRAIISQMSAETVRDIYQRHGSIPEGHWDGIDSLKKLHSELGKIRRQKIVVTEPAFGDSERNAFGYASPLFRNGVCIGAIGIARKPFSDEQTDALMRKVLTKGTREIQRRLDYEGE